MMQDTKKAAPVLQHQDGRVETGPDFQSGPHSYSQSTTSPPPGQGVHIADFLSNGPENGITLRHLEKLTDLSGREVRRQIERERRAGVLIISDNKSGYFLASNLAEARRFAQSMLHRSREIAKTARAVKTAAERMVD